MPEKRSHRELESSAMNSILHDMILNKSNDISILKQTGANCSKENIYGERNPCVEMHKRRTEGPESGCVWCKTTANASTTQGHIFAEAFELCSWYILIFTCNSIE